MLPFLIFLLAPAALGENSSLDDMAVYIQQRLKPARPTRWGAEIWKEGACLAVIFDLHDLKRPNELTPGARPPFEMSMSWSTDACQPLAAPPEYKTRSGAFFAHWGCRLDVYEGDSCNGASQNVAYGSPQPPTSQFTTKKRLHPGGNEERFYKSARCHCSQIAGLNMREADGPSLEKDGEVLEEAESQEVSEDEERSEEGALQEVEEDRSSDFEEEDSIVNSSSPEAQFEEEGEDSIVNSSSPGDFRSYTGCIFHSNNGQQFSGADFFKHFNARRRRSWSSRRRSGKLRRKGCHTFTASNPPRNSFYTMAEKDCEMHIHSGEGCQGRSRKLFEAASRPEKFAGSSVLVTPWWDASGIKSIGCWCYDV